MDPLENDCSRGNALLRHLLSCRKRAKAKISQERIIDCISHDVRKISELNEMIQVKCAKGMAETRRELMDREDKEDRKGNGKCCVHWPPNLKTKQITKQITKSCNINQSEEATLEETLRISQSTFENNSISIKDQKLLSDEEYIYEEVGKYVEQKKDNEPILARSGSLTELKDKFLKRSCKKKSKRIGSEKTEKEMDQEDKEERKGNGKYIQPNLYEEYNYEEVGKYVEQKKNNEPILARSGRLTELKDEFLKRSLKKKSKRMCSEKTEKEMDQEDKEDRKGNGKYIQPNLITKQTTKSSNINQSKEANILTPRDEYMQISQFKTTMEEEQGKEFAISIQPKLKDQPKLLKTCDILHSKETKTLTSKDKHRTTNDSTIKEMSATEPIENVKYVNASKEEEDDRSGEPSRFALVPVKSCMDLTAKQANGCRKSVCRSKCKSSTEGDSGDIKTLNTPVIVIACGKTNASTNSESQTGPAGKCEKTQCLLKLLCRSRSKGKTCEEKNQAKKLNRDDTKHNDMTRDKELSTYEVIEKDVSEYKDVYEVELKDEDITSETDEDKLRYQSKDEVGQEELSVEHPALILKTVNIKLEEKKSHESFSEAMPNEPPDEIRHREFDEEKEDLYSKLVSDEDDYLLRRLKEMKSRILINIENLCGDCNPDRDICEVNQEYSMCASQDIIRSY